jgi:hypothetical protein
VGCQAWAEENVQVPSDQAWQPAVGPPLERRVRLSPRFCPDRCELRSEKVLLRVPAQANNQPENGCGLSREGSCHETQSEHSRYLGFETHGLPGRRPEPRNLKFRSPAPLLGKTSGLCQGEPHGRAVLTRDADAGKCSLTFELSGRRRQATRPGPVKMYSVPPARAWWPAVGAPLERRVRLHLARSR